MVKNLYFALNTLSTVGYGDFAPTNESERYISLIIMLGGVAFFSYIMSNFIEIISNYDKKMGVIDKSRDLHDWINIITKFSNMTTPDRKLTS
jgi:voltage-gated potassium channel Kch